MRGYGSRGPLEPSPWEQRDRLGFFPALFETWRRATLHPTAFFSTLAPGGIGAPWGYAALIGVASSIVGALALSAIPGVDQAFGGMSLLPRLLFGAIGASIGVWIWAAVLHVCALIVGASSQGFDATFRAVAFSTGPTVFAIVPFVGSLVSSIWCLVLLVIALQHLQRTTSGRAVLTIALPSIALLLCVCAVGAMFAGSAAMLMGFSH